MIIELSMSFFSLLKTVSIKELLKAKNWKETNSKQNNRIYILLNLQ